jgi:hypothetical protein
MLAVPDEWPLLLKGVEHRKVSIVQPVSRANRQFYTVDNHGQTGASLLCGCQAVREEFNLNRRSGRSLPTERFGSNLDKIYQTTLVQV